MYRWYAQYVMIWHYYRLNKTHWIIINELTEFISTFKQIFIDIVDIINGGRVRYLTPWIRLTLAKLCSLQNSRNNLSIYFQLDNGMIEATSVNSVFRRSATLNCKLEVFRLLLRKRVPWEGFQQLFSQHPVPLPDHFFHNESG